MTKTLLSRDTMNYALSIATSGTIHVNHPECPAGEDTRKRLYITIPSNNKLLLCHCFNCGGSGIIKLSRTKPLLDPRDSATPVAMEKLERFYTAKDRYNKAIKLTGSAPLVWPIKYFHDCQQEFMDADYFGMKEDLIRFFIPRGNPPNDITGYDIRFKDNDDDRPKYIRYIHPDYADDSKLLIYNPSNSRTGVICEDPISAMKIALAGYAGIALCGSKMPTEDIQRVLILFDIIGIWLDNDNATVQAERERIANTFALYTDKVFVERLLKDPKQYSLDTIKDVITNGQLI